MQFTNVQNDVYISLFFSFLFFLDQNKDESLSRTTENVSFFLLTTSVHLIFLSTLNNTVQHMEHFAFDCIFSYILFSLWGCTNILKEQISKQSDGQGLVLWLRRARMWDCVEYLHQLQQGLDGLCQVMVWYQLAGLQGCAAKSLCLAHRNKHSNCSC